MFKCKKFYVCALVGVTIKPYDIFSGIQYLNII